MAETQKNYLDMSVAELRTEIAANFEQADKIEGDMAKGEYRDEDATQVKSILEEIDLMEDVLSRREDAEERKARIMQGVERYKKPAKDAFKPVPTAADYERGASVTPGDQFVMSREYRDLKNTGKFNSNLSRVEFSVDMTEGTSLLYWADQMKTNSKTLLYGSSASSGGGFVVNDRLAGYVDIMQREIVFLDLVPRIPTTSDTVEYVTEDTFTNSGAFVIEATATTGTSGQKAESALAYSVSTSGVKTLAHWIPVTNRMLADAPAIRGIVNGRLLLGLDLTLETQVVSGNGSGANFTGILSTTGINIQGKGTDNELDTIFKARTQIVVTGKGRPGAVLLHPNDWQSIRLTRENVSTGTLGNYLMGPPSQVGPSTVWGLPVVESQALTENTGLIGDFQQGCTLFDREQSAVRVGTINAQFIRNMQTLLAELRASFVVFRPTMFTKITGI